MLVFFVVKHKDAASIISAYCILIMAEELIIIWMENNRLILKWLWVDQGWWGLIMTSPRFYLLYLTSQNIHLCLMHCQAASDIFEFCTLSDFLSIKINNCMRAVGGWICFSRCDILHIPSRYLDFTLFLCNNKWYYVLGICASKSQRTHSVSLCQPVWCLCWSEILPPLFFAFVLVGDYSPLSSSSMLSHRIKMLDQQNGDHSLSLPFFL